MEVGITGLLINFLLSEKGSCSVAQAGLDLVTLQSRPSSAKELFIHKNVISAQNRL